jgi:hypothetical protein
MVPIHLLAEERGRVFTLSEDTSNEARRRERQRTLEKWQTEWDCSNNGRWTHRLIPNITEWISRAHGEVTYRLTQCLSGHGVFYAYLKRIRKIDSDACMYCGMEDTAEHTLFRCDRWSRERETAMHRLQLESFPAVAELVECMLRGKTQWGEITGLIEIIMRQKEKDEMELKS